MSFFTNRSTSMITATQNDNTVAANKQPPEITEDLTNTVDIPSKLKPLDTKKFALSGRRRKTQFGAAGILGISSTTIATEENLIPKQIDGELRPELAEAFKNYN